MSSGPDVVFMFSGQGSQYYQMGRDLFEANRLFRDRLSDLDETAQALLGVSIIDMLYDERRQRGDRFDRLLYSNAAIYMVECALGETLIAEGLRPDRVLGASMGCFAAAVAAGALTKHQGLAAAIRQAEVVERHCQKGAMFAVLAPAGLLDADPELHGRWEVAALNLPSHHVVATEEAFARQVERSLRRQGVTFQRLPLAFAFHSRWIDGAKEPYLDFLGSLAIGQSAVPMVSCTSGQAAEVSAGFFWSAARETIRLMRTIQALEAQRPCVYLDAGPAGTMATFVRHLLRDSDTRSSQWAILTPFGAGAANMERVLRALLG